MYAQHRIVQNDPEYDRITGLRRAREQRFNAKVLAILGVPAILLYGLGLVFLLVAGCYLVSAMALEAKFQQ
jgi:hypothetical protein